ncbi:MAG TPA: Hpt domain-containing protein [Caldimonas sp.]|jgi:HPt (histidine-containing phosphotransfer) domain-containing protein|nr:Hpt domain-containing protein [Caldimonas sp.]HEX2541369.1 Hpt domain-containing protein [Caldimonas sp.]
MPATPIDAATFAELQATAGADFVAELIDTFLEEAPPMIEALRESLAAGQAEGFRRAAHSLKSNAGTFGALTLASMARELELNGIEAARASGALDRLAEHYADVAAELKALRDA